MRYLTATVDMPDWMLHPMQEFARDTDAVEYEELVTWNFGRDTDTECELFYVVGDRERYREAVEDVESVLEYFVTPVDEKSFYVYAVQETREADVTFRAAWGNLDLVVVPPIIFEDGGRIRLTVVGDVSDIETVVERFPEGLEVTIHEIGEFDHRYGALAGALTDRQFEAVRTAVELGYYEKPREGRLQDVADALDCARSTASNHLQKAEAAVMKRIVDRTTPLG